MDDTILEVKDLSKVYGIYSSPAERLKESLFPGKRRHRDFHALQGVSFSLGRGEILGIMGQNGAGKSTLLKIISGVLEPSSGSVTVRGQISSLLELGAGFNMENTGLENIYFYGSVMGIGRGEMKKRVPEILDFAELGDYVNQPVKCYSSGMFARLAFSCAINVDPQLLIVDEILSVGDIRFQAKCFNKFKEFKKRGVTILYVGHDISVQRSFCDRCIWLDKGRIAAMGDPTEITARYTQYMYRSGTEAAPKAQSGPIAHWGTRRGLIRDVLFLADGRDFQFFETGRELDISFIVPYDEGLDYAHLSASFSIKDREGTDLFVGTTWHQGVALKAQAQRISFRFRCDLAAGDYYLVLALENKSNASTEYYEYIEGAKYFKVTDSKNRYGRFLADISISTEEEE